jgi:hypothetical protein
MRLRSPWLHRVGLGVLPVLVLVVVPASAAAATELAPGGTFLDDDGSVHEGMIEAIAALGITTGCTADGRYFCPDHSVTRGQLAAFIRRAFSLAPSAVDAFLDDDGSVFEADIQALAGAGVLRGCDPPANVSACPGGVVSREQMASFLVRAAALPPVEGDVFADDDGSVHEPDIQALAEAGISFGCNPPANDRFCPGEPVSRAQMASFLGRALHLDPLIPPPALIGLGTSCIDERSPSRPSGELVVAPGESAVFGEADRVVTFVVEVEEGLPVDIDCFARVVEIALADSRSWIGTGTIAMQRVDEGTPSVRVTLASPDTTDAYCLPLRTGGIFSCWDGSRAMINFWRWEEGADSFGDDMVGYRTYVINHEVGHGLGHGHASCTGSGDPAPVMMQQTKGVGSCLPNGWPTAAELS